MAAARVASATLALTLVAGCVGARPEPTGVAQVFEPPQQLRERPGAFAVFAASPDEVRRNINYEVSTPIRGAEEGAGYGMRSIGQVAQIGQIVHPLATLALISGAAIVGAVMAHDADEVNATETNLRRALSEAGAAEQFADLLTAAAQRLSEPPQVRRSRLGDGLFLAAAPARIGSTASAAWTMVPEEDQAATLLETSLPALTLSGERGFDPEVTLYIEAAVRLLDAQDRSLLWQRSYVYRSPPSAFFDLGKSDAAKLEEVLQRGLAKLAFAASFDVFAARHPEVHPDPDRWSSLPEDTVWAVRRTASPLPSPKPGGVAVVSAQNGLMPVSRLPCCGP